MKKYLLGVDIGGTSIKIGRFDLMGELLAKWDLPTDRTDAGAHILKDIYESITARVAWDDVKGIGFGVPGPVAQNVALTCVNLGWGRTDVAAGFGAYLRRDDIPIMASNDANVACSGEVFRGVATGYRNVFMFTLGTGVGGGVMIDGKLVDGTHGAAGELGHYVVDFTHRIPCRCGKAGCLETVGSATGIVNLAKLRLRASTRESLLRGFPAFSAKRVLDLAKAGDGLALEVIDEAADYLGRATAAVLVTVNPEIVVFGGGVANAGGFLIDKIAAKAREYALPLTADTPIVSARLGNDAGIYGAAYLVR